MNLWVQTSIITAVFNPDLNNEIHINPIPAIDYLLIEINTQQQEEMVVFDINGLEKMNKMIYSSEKLDIRDFKNEVYFL